MRLLLVFLKEPIPGQVKTRLATEVGAEEAARYYKAMVEVILKQLRGLQNCRIRFCYAPKDAEETIRFWILPEMNATSSEQDGVYRSPIYTSSQDSPQEIDFRYQGDGNLGQKIEHSFASGFTEGFQSIAVIGTDCPACGARWINAAFSRLESNPSRDGIIGPSLDGGYYLLALKSHTPELFQEIPWSSKHVLNSTLNAAQKNNLSFIQLPPLTDIDHLDDWKNLLESPLGAAIKKALGEELENDNDFQIET